MLKKRFGVVGGFSSMTFSERVVLIALSIPKGKVTTYGRIARAAGAGNMASKSITCILAKAHEKGKKNIPFHRIVYADGRIWITDNYRKERLKKYKSEKIVIDARDRVVNFPEICIDTFNVKNAA